MNHGISQCSCNDCGMIATSSSSTRNGSTRSSLLDAVVVAAEVEEAAERHRQQQEGFRNLQPRDKEAIFPVPSQPAFSSTLSFSSSSSPSSSSSSSLCTPLSSPSPSISHSFPLIHSTPSILHQHHHHPNFPLFVSRLDHTFISDPLNQTNGPLASENNLKPSFPDYPLYFGDKQQNNQRKEEELSQPNIANMGMVVVPSQYLPWPNESCQENGLATLESTMVAASRWPTTTNMMMTTMNLESSKIADEGGGDESVMVQMGMRLEQQPPPPPPTQSRKLESRPLLVDAQDSCPILHDGRGTNATHVDTHPHVSGAAMWQETVDSSWKQDKQNQNGVEDDKEKQKREQAGWFKPSNIQMEDTERAVKNHVSVKAVVAPAPLSLPLQPQSQPQPQQPYREGHQHPTPSILLLPPSEMGGSLGVWTPPPSATQHCHPPTTHNSYFQPNHHATAAWKIDPDSDAYGDVGGNVDLKPEPVSPTTSWNGYHSFSPFPSSYQDPACTTATALAMSVDTTTPYSSFPSRYYSDLELHRDLSLSRGSWTSETTPSPSTTRSTTDSPFSSSSSSSLPLTPLSPSFGSQQPPPSSSSSSLSPSSILNHPRRSSSVFKCSFSNCRKTFVSNWNLTQHIQTHNNHRTKPFRCPYTDCERTYFYRRDLQRHLRKVHHRVWVS